MIQQWVGVFIDACLCDPSRITSPLPGSRLCGLTIFICISIPAAVNVMVATMWWPPVDQLGIPQRANQHAADAWHTAWQTFRTVVLDRVKA